MITIVDYGLGNVRAIENIYKRLEVPVNLAQSPDQLHGAKKIILPGVGAFDWAMNRLNQSGMRPMLDELVRSGSEVLGICVGMQMMANRSDEGSMPGLSWIDAEVKIFDRTCSSRKIPLPHMGWNDVTPNRFDSLFQGMELGAQFYFLHSYYFAPHRQSDALSTTDYIGSFVSSIRSDNVYGVQFHPEKSHQWGIRLLKNFAEI